MVLESGSQEVSRGEGPGAWRLCSFPRAACNNRQQMGKIKTTERYPLTVLEFGTLKSRCQQ